MVNIILGLALLVPCVVFLHDGNPPDLFAWYKSKMIVLLGLAACPLLRWPSCWAFIFSYIILLIAAPYHLLWGSPNMYEGLLVWLSYLVLFSLAIDRRKEATRYMAFLLVSVFVVCVVGYLQVIGLRPIDWLVIGGRFTRSNITSMIYNENYVGHFGAFLCPLFLVLTLRKRSLKHLIIFMALTLLIIISKSLLGVIASSLCFVLIAVTLKQLSLSRKIILFLVLLAAVSPLKSRLTNFDWTLGKRTYLWTYVLEDIELWGHGPGTLASRWKAPISSQIKNYRHLVALDRPHSLYLGIAHSFGWLGLALYLALITEYLVRGLRLRVWRLRKPIYFAVWSGVIGYHIAGLVNDSGVFFGSVFWVIFGLGYWIPRPVKFPVLR